MIPDIYTVSQFVVVVNQILETAVPFVMVEGEVSEYKVRAGKWASFKLKDEEAILDCFCGVWQLRTPIEDGMRVVVAARPSLKPKWGIFSLNVQQINPVGEGAFKRAYELLKQKLMNEGLFAEERKRPLPLYPLTIGVVSSEEAAGYADFLKILADRWPQAEIFFAHAQVQGQTAADQLIAAVRQLNELAHPPEVIAMVRGGGSREDLAAFNDEQLVRAVASSRVPIVVGIGHEQDETLAELAADQRAATPTHAAQIISPDAIQLQQTISQLPSQFQRSLQTIYTQTEQIVSGFSRGAHLFIQQQERGVQLARQSLYKQLNETVNTKAGQAESLKRILQQCSPLKQLQKGYAIIRKDKQLVRSATQLNQGDKIELTLHDGRKAAVVNGD